MKDELYEKRIKHLRNYADWERDHSGEKIHILDWAANEIESLRAQLGSGAVQFNTGGNVIAKPSQVVPLDKPVTQQSKDVLAEALAKGVRVTPAFAKVSSYLKDHHAITEEVIGSAILLLQKSEYVGALQELRLGVARLDVLSEAQKVTP